MKEEINKALQVLSSGGTILYPTDTVWGIGCDATDRVAVEKILTLKKRKPGKGFIVLVDSVDMLKKIVKKIPESFLNLINTSSSPLTIIYPDVTGIAGNVMAEDGSAGIRITGDAFCRKLIGLFKKPIVSTSANVSREAVPGCFDEITEPILNGVDHIVNLRKNEKTGHRLSGIIKISINGGIEVKR